MGVTYPLAFPASLPVRAKVTCRMVVAVSESPYTLAGQVQEWSGQRWELELGFPRMPRAQAEALNVFRLKLGGPAGTFLYGDPAGRSPRGSAAGAPVVSGSGQSGNQLVTGGWTPSATGVLLAGDYIQLGSGATARLHKVLEDADADGSGSATLTIWPRLREAPTDAAPLVVENCVGVFRMVSNAQSWDEEAALYGGGEIQAVEVV